MKKFVSRALLLYPCMLLLMAFQDQQTPPSHHEELKKLDWLIGKWVDQDNEGRLLLDYSWDENKNFLTDNFSVLTKEKKMLDGKVIIGWDPAKKQIRSWLFDSDGSFGHGKWRQMGDKWIVETAHTLANGESASSINIYTKIDNDSYTFESTGRTVDGELLPDIEPVKVIRKKD